MVNIAVLGATGMVGQRLVCLLENHPFFKVTKLAASPNSKGHKYGELMEKRWKLNCDVPEYVKDMVLYDLNEVESVADGSISMVFCAVDMDKKAIVEIEETYAKAEVVVVSNNSANRWTEDVPMLIPEINAHHLDVVEVQKKRLGTKKGFIITKPNCSIQSYMGVIDALKEFEPTEMSVCTYQAISGSGRTFKEWPEMVDNLIPYIGGEEEKSEQEPLKILGQVKDGVIEKASLPVISAQCYRVPVTDGHMAAVSISFKKKPTKEEFIEAIRNYKVAKFSDELPHSPKEFMTYFEEDNRPQTGIDRDLYGGMGVSIGRIREDHLFDYKFACLSHNTLRGAAGGALLSAELLYKMGLIE